MEFSAEHVAAELKNLCRGFGIDDPAAPARIGGALRHVAGLTDGDGPAEQVAKVRLRLLDLADGLPPNLAATARVSLGLDGPSDHRVGVRISHLAAELQCDPRTVRRRADAAFLRLAEEALATTGGPGPRRGEDPCHVGRLKVLVLLERSTVEVIEERHIVSHRDGLTEIEHSHTVVPPNDERSSLDPLDLGITVLRGGVLTSQERVSTSRVGFRVRLPHPLDRGKGHDVTIRLTAAVALAPFYVCTPRYACRRFDLTVRFGTTMPLPEHVRLIEDELPLEAGDSSLQRTTVPIDAAREANASFSGLEANRSYGLSWDTSAQRE
ncbi:hypothetical protein BTM25_02780 [Actinomadura rubteroloni]|uniref:Uncharacterized protein n=1 Tax=Actinomadura rubteroloni TaxID=1926885 RepID=A0A2P4ULG9_9ACTN|nr:hypothetical protein [Actinomadura rubteroloni]POM25894.1 hypothetical protein BTM25_02780 [Actinomadura rubteroloni]